MLRRLLSIIAKRWKTLVALILSTLILWVAFQWVIFQGYSLAWTGFGDYITPSGEFVRGKTLWDWMELLIIPIFLAAGAFYLDQSERKSEREIAVDHQQEETLQTYLTRMGELLLMQRLRTSRKAEVRDMARIQTLTVLRKLDAKRKRIVLLFLEEAGLIRKEPVINLAGADFTGTDLNRANLGGANLTEANLKGAKLVEAILVGAVLMRTDLTGADLTGASLAYAYANGANLLRSILKGVDLRKPHWSVRF